jgi:hypothetical protein
MAYVHATFMKKVFHIPQREWKPYIKHNCNLNDLMTGFEIPKGYRIIHSCAAKSRINVKQVYLTEPKKSLHGLKEVNKLACRALVTGHSN